MCLQYLIIKKIILLYSEFRGIQYSTRKKKKQNKNSGRIAGVMVSVLAFSVVDRGFDPQSGQTQDYNTGMCCFSAKHTSLSRKNKYWLARNQHNVFACSDMFTHELLFQWASAIKIQLSVLVWIEADLIIISLQTNLFSPWYSWKIAELALSYTHSLSYSYTWPITFMDHNKQFNNWRVQANFWAQNSF